MASSARIGARRGHIAAVDVQQWPEVDPDALSDKRRALYLKRRQAVTMYLAGASDADLMRDTGIALPTVHRLITQCSGRAAGAGDRRHPQGGVPGGPDQDGRCKSRQRWGAGYGAIRRP
jgi:hypothetical protein